MYVYSTPIGLLKLVRIQGIYYFMFGNDDTAWTGHPDPWAVADDVYCHVTGCSVWDNSHITGPTDLSEWERR